MQILVPYARFHVRPSVRDCQLIAKNAQHARAKYEPAFTNRAVARLLMAEGRGVEAGPQ